MKKTAVLGKGPVVNEMLGRKVPVSACAAVLSPQQCQLGIRPHLLGRSNKIRHQRRGRQVKQ